LKRSSTLIEEEEEEDNVGVAYNGKLFIPNFVKIKLGSTVIRGTETGTRTLWHHKHMFPYKKCPDSHTERVGVLASILYVPSQNLSSRD
jgi:hypothetical protein